MSNQHIVPVAANGRMNLPSAIRAKLELQGGGKVVFIETRRLLTTLLYELVHYTVAVWDIATNEILRPSKGPS
jgi:AbrB family looped-hinge helix DNA binding protein